MAHSVRVPSPEVLRERYARQPSPSGGSQAVRTAREQLSDTPDFTGRVAHDRLAMLVRNELSAGKTSLLMTVVVGLAALVWAPWTEVALAVVAIVAAKLLLLEAGRRFEADPEAKSATAAWHRRLVWHEAGNGVAWAALVLAGIGGEAALFHDSQPVAEPIGLFGALVVVLAVRMALAAPSATMLCVGTIPMTLAVIARISLASEPFHLVLAVLAGAMQVCFLFLAGSTSRTARTMLAYRAEKDALIAEIEAERALAEAARRRAEEANVAKSRFLATMSHELRTPLNAILGFSEVMSREVMGPLANPVYKDYAGSIHQSGTHLLNLINEILDLSRIEAGRYDFVEESVRLVDIVDDCRRLLKLKAEAKGLAVHVDFDETLPPIRADERAIRQICLNLMSNALKFTPRGGTVALIVEPTDNGGQRLRVRDNGPGIPADELPRVLEAFGQGSLAHQTAEGGTGLGLPIVRSLAELHDGRFELRSELRRGTEAIVELPASRVVGAVPAPPLTHVMAPPAARPPRGAIAPRAC
ncbi:MAG: sensor histidine kinase [Hyphomicrobiaceae bacterium]